ncbi:hypothetical protein DFP72DRAFT_944243 [Ephemerocybe angulata]|uniref:Secreted protein n=1 Tax=Ephemerocybe angulata TaxID=980116 RepID=A0A8H6H6Q5_9AGAR|nr:hypothetical protein DFP72DRAFT_944243 [Tulosesus angulatus]
MCVLTFCLCCMVFGLHPRMRSVQEEGGRGGRRGYSNGRPTVGLRDGHGHVIRKTLDEMNVRSLSAACFFLAFQHTSLAIEGLGVKSIHSLFPRRKSPKVPSIFYAALVDTR